MLSELLSELSRLHNSNYNIAWRGRGREKGRDTVVIHRKKKDGGCTFYHNTLRTKLSPLGVWKDMVKGSRSYTNNIALVEFE